MAPSTMRERRPDQGRKALAGGWLWRLRPVALGALLGVLGPFGGYAAAPLGARLAFWIVAVSVVWLLVEAVLRAATRWLRARGTEAVWAAPIAAAALAWGPALLVVIGSGRLFLGRDFGANLVALAWQVRLILAVVTVGAASVERLRAGRRADPDAEGAPRAEPFAGPPPGAARDAADAADAVDRFRARWPRGLEGRLLALAMEDHYLRVHTDAGAGLILCRMRDAERELAAADGRRVHRSYWVARPAVARVERRGRRPVLILENGLEVPVGRSYAAGLRAAGWL